MTVPIDLDVGELAATRFAVSPLSETVSALQLLGGVQRQRPENLRWLRWATDELARAPLALPVTWPLLVNRSPSWPAFLVPAPTDAAPSIEDELAAVRRTTARQVRSSVRRAFGDEPPAAVAELVAQPAAGLRMITAELRAAHDRLIAPQWTRIRAVLDADVAYRARLLANGGLDQLFGELHPDLIWRDGRLTYRVGNRRNPVMHRGPGGLVLMPVALGSAHVLVKLRTYTQTTVRYPARGVGTLWSAGTRPPAGGVVRLLGRVRAELLEALRSPATTTDLARAFGVTPSAVSQHLAVLRENGLVSRERSGRTVLYLATPLGVTLTTGR